MFKRIGRWAAPVVLMLACAAVSAATRDFDPYVPGEGLVKLAAELGLSPQEILLDRRCVYTKTDRWIPQTPIDTMSTCTLVLTPDRVILADYDSVSKVHRIDLSFEYAKLASVALHIKEISDTSWDLDGRKIQVQFATEQGFLSVTAWRSPPKVKPMDTRSAVDAFELIKSKGVPVVQSQGRIDVFRPKTFFGIPLR
jgi:hypothetical protein